MIPFFICYLIIYYIDLIQFMVYNRMFQFKDISAPGNQMLATFYVSLLELLSFTAVSRLYITKDLSGLIDLILIRIETLAAYLYIYLVKRFYLPIITYFATNMVLLCCFYFYWPFLYNIVLQSYSKKIGLDVTIKDIYIIRHIYSGAKKITYIGFVIFLLMHLVVNSKCSSNKYYIYLLIIPVVLIRFLDKEETEKENRMAKFTTIVLLIIISGCLIWFSILHIVAGHSREFYFLNFVNVIQFSLISFLSILDYFNFGKGLKEAIRYKKDLVSRRI